MEIVSQSKVKELAHGAPNSGNIEVRLSNPKRTGVITIREYIDKDGKDRPYVDQNGQHRVLKIRKKLNLQMSDQNDRLTYMQIKNHPLFLEGSTKCLVIYDHEAEATESVNNKDLEAKAMGIIANLEGEELKDFARVLLITVRPGSSDKVLKSVIYDKAAEDPQLVLDEWNNPLKEHVSMLRKGIEKGVFENRFGRFTFSGELMGTTFDQSVDWLKENEDLMPQLRKEIG